MCTAITYQPRELYMGRSLDYEASYGEEIVMLPRRFPLRFRHGGGHAAAAGEGTSVPAGLVQFGVFQLGYVEPPGLKQGIKIAGCRKGFHIKFLQYIKAHLPAQAVIILLVQPSLNIFKEVVPAADISLLPFQLRRPTIF